MHPGGHGDARLGRPEFPSSMLDADRAEDLKRAAGAAKHVVDALEASTGRAPPPPDADGGDAQLDALGARLEALRARGLATQGDDSSASAAFSDEVSLAPSLDASLSGISEDGAIQPDPDAAPTPRLTAM